mmetsp:Transcript_12610/g.9142  ORF Transcript_12610/g.9142 Transcript_12610/m.9142 type:complete len:88 (+) Transcript_12610:349-612(+)
MKGTCRYFSEKTLEKVKELTTQITSNICEANECTYDIITHDTKATPMINAKAPFEALDEVLAGVVGKEFITREGAPSMGVDDFSNFQ